MRYAVELAELSAALDRVAGIPRADGRGAARRLEPVARALPGGATAAALPGVVERWRARERLVWDGVAAHAGHLGEAIEAYVEVEARAVDALGELR